MWDGASANGSLLLDIKPGQLNPQTLLAKMCSGNRMVEDPMFQHQQNVNDANYFNMFTDGVGTIPCGYGTSANSSLFTVITGWRRIQYPINRIWTMQNTL